MVGGFSVPLENLLLGMSLDMVLRSVPEVHHGKTAFNAAVRLCQTHLQPRLAKKVWDLPTTYRLLADVKKQKLSSNVFLEAF